MVISTAIIEDDSAQAELLKGCLNELETSSLSFDISCFESAEEFLATLQSGKYQLIFQDIQLKKMDGLSCARRVRSVDEDVIIVFITSMAQFAINGYEVDAKDYILKPVIFDSFQRKMRRILPMIKERRDILINIAPEGLDPEMVRAEDLIFVENFGHKLIYHLSGRERESYGTISAAEEKLRPYKFIRCNRNTVINSRLIEFVRDNTVKVGDYELSISSTRKKEFLSELNELIGG